MDRYCFEREKGRGRDNDRNRDEHMILSDDFASIYCIYDRQRGLYDPLAYVMVLADAELLVDALNGIVNNPSCSSIS